MRIDLFNHVKCLKQCLISNNVTCCYHQNCSFKWFLYLFLPPFIPPYPFPPPRILLPRCHHHHIVVRIPEFVLFFFSFAQSLTLNPSIKWSCFMYWDYLSLYCFKKNWKWNNGEIPGHTYYSALSPKHWEHLHDFLLPYFSDYKMHSAPNLGGKCGCVLQSECSLPGSLEGGRRWWWSGFFFHIFLLLNLGTSYGPVCFIVRKIQ